MSQGGGAAAASAEESAIPQHHLPYGGLAPHEVPADYDYDAVYNGSNVSVNKCFIWANRSYY